VAQPESKVGKNPGQQDVTPQLIPDIDGIP
jgi:hypothetical protein